MLTLAITLIIALALLVTVGVISQPTASYRGGTKTQTGGSWTIGQLDGSRFVAGRTATGAGLIHRFPGDHRLITGVTRSGKSCTMHALLWAFSASPDAAFVGVDPKRTELGLWAPRFTQVAVNLADIDQAIARTVQLMKTRQQFLEINGETKWRTEFGPWVFLVIDEYAELVGISTEGLDRTDEATDIDKHFKRGRSLSQIRIADVSSLARLGAGLGIKLIIATQYPTADVLDTQIRNQLDTRIAHRVNGIEQVRVCVGAGRADTIGVNSIPSREQGGLWIVGSEDYNEPMRARSTYVPADHIPARANQTAGLAWTWEQLLSLQTLTDKQQGGTP